MFEKKNKLDNKIAQLIGYRKEVETFHSAKTLRYL